MLIEADSNSIGRSIEQLEPRPWGLLGEFADGYSKLLGSGALIRLCVAPWIAVVLMVGLLNWSFDDNFKLLLNSDGFTDVINYQTPHLGMVHIFSIARSCPGISYF